MPETNPPFLPNWTPKIILSLIGVLDKATGDGAENRKRILEKFDKSGMTVQDAATLHTFKITHEMKVKIDQLMAPPEAGEQTQLEKMISLLEALLQAVTKVLKGQVGLDRRIAALEAAIIELRSSSNSAG